MSESLQVINEDDFKYFMQDAAKLYLGARTSYRELTDHEYVPFKLKTVINRYLTLSVSEDTTLEQHLYHMTREDDAFLAYRELKAKVRFVERVKNTDPPLFRERVSKINEFALITNSEKEERGIVVRELVISKLALFAFNV